MTNTALVVDKHMKLIIWTMPRLAAFPKDQRFFLADRIQSIMLDVLELLVEAVYSKEKVPALTKANLQLEKMRLLMRIAADMKYISLKRYDYFCRSVLEIGKMIGGWKKFAGNQSPGVQGCQERGGRQGEVQVQAPSGP